MITCKAEKFTFAVRARLNAGADARTAVMGATRECGALRAVRVSSAQAKGAAKQYAYWGAVRYAVRLSADGQRLVVAALERASSDRRTEAGAERDAEALADSEDRIETSWIGGVTANQIVVALGLAEASELRAVAAIEAFARAC